MRQLEPLLYQIVIKAIIIASTGAPSVHVCFVVLMFCCFVVLIAPSPPPPALPVPVFPCRHRLHRPVDPGQSSPACIRCWASRPTLRCCHAYNPTRATVSKRYCEHAIPDRCRTV
jgi:hypothetical protein